MISAIQGEGRLKGIVHKFSDVQFKDPITSIVYWGHWMTQTENCGKEEMNKVTATLWKSEARNSVFWYINGVPPALYKRMQNSKVIEMQYKCVTVTPLITLPVKFKHTVNGFKLTALGTVPCKTHSYVTWFYYIPVAHTVLKWYMWRTFIVEKWIIVCV